MPARTARGGIEGAPLPRPGEMDLNCVFCMSEGGRRVFRDALCRVVVTDEPFAGFCRVIWNSHVTEMTDLPPSARVHFMEAVFAVEAALRALLSPRKLNLASLGNQVPHLHWHVVPRFAEDSHFPNPVWGAPVRPASPFTLPADFDARLAAHLARALPSSERP